MEGCEVHNVGSCLSSFSVKFLSAVYQILSKAYAIRRLLTLLQPDILHGHYATNYGFLAALTKFHPLVQTVHGSDVMVDLKRSFEGRFFVKFALRSADLITSPAQHMTAALKAAGIGHEIKTLQYGIETDLFSPPGDEFRRNPFKVVSTRHFEWKYNVGLLIRAIPFVLSRIREASFVLAGEGPDKMGLERLAEELGISDSIRWVGRIAHEEMPELLRSSTVYVSTSVTDGASLSLLEAMGCEVYPVVTDIPANREWITNGQNGFLVPGDRPDILSARIVEALERADFRSAAVEKNLQMVRERGSYERNMTEMEGLYEKLLSP